MDGGLLTDLYILYIQQHGTYEKMVDSGVK